MEIKVKNRLILLLSAMLLAQGCDSFTPHQLEGHYEGYWSLQGKESQNEPLAADAQMDANSALQVTLTSLDGKKQWTLTGKSEQLNGLRLDLSGALGFPPLSALLRHRKDERKDCLAAQDNDKILHLCYLEGELSLTLDDLKSGTKQRWVLCRFALPQPLDLEEPRAYTLGHLFEQAASRNFDSRVEFEHVFQARATAISAHRNLLPHISMNTLAALVSISVSSVLSDLSDVLPFILPSRWAQWHKADLRANAALDAYVLMRADSANLVEGLTYTAMQDTEILDVLSRNQNYVKTFNEQIAARRSLESADDIAAILSETQRTSSAMQNTVEQDYHALAQAMGFMNPKAITNVSFNPEWDPLNPPILTSEELVPRAIRRSFELRQLDHLIEAAKHAKVERMYSWMDPFADSASAFGFGWGAYVKVGESEIRELQIKREQMQASLINKVETAISNANQAAEAYGIALKGIEIQNRRLERLAKEVREGKKNSALKEFVDVFEARVQNEVASVTSRYTFYTAHAKLQRLTFEGKYARFMQLDIPAERLQLASGRAVARRLGYGGRAHADLDEP